MSKYVHGRGRLATASPRVGEYDYGTKSYSPSDYYGDHFMYRDDPNLLPVRKGLYASYSPVPSQNALTAFPPPMLVDKHNSSYHSWTPSMETSPSYLSGSHLAGDGISEFSDEELLDLVEAEEFVEDDPSMAEQVGSALWDAWNSLSDEQKDQAAELVYDTVTGGDAQSAVEAAGMIAFTQLSDSDLLSTYTKAREKRFPYSPNELGYQNWVVLKRGLFAEILKRGLIQLRRVQVKNVNLTKTSVAQQVSAICKAFPNDPRCKSSGGSGGSRGGKSNNTALIIGAAVGLLAVLALK